MKLRRLAETVVRRSLLAVPGISQVVPIGGEVREYLVELDPAAVVQAGIPVEEVVAALEASSATPAAGFHVDAGQEYLVAWPRPSALHGGAGQHRPPGPGPRPPAPRPDRLGPPGPRARPGHDRVFQLGIQIHAGDNYHRVVELVRSGVLGDIRTVHIWKIGGSPGMGFPANGEPPRALDFDMWLGPAPEVAYNPARCHFSYRYFLEYSGGVYQP